ncbi:MAG: hypothetical protein V1729_04125 [Candidatus Woesearchaeota archaeon]
MISLIKKAEVGLEEFLLLFLILIEALDFFTVIPSQVEYIEKVLAILAICYLFYRASITKIIFGFSEKNYDLLIVIAYLSLSIKTLIGFLISVVHESGILKSFYTMILSNAGIIEKTGFWIGGIMMLVVSALLVNEHLRKPCVLGIIHEDRAAITITQKIVRFVSIYLLLLSTYLIVFTFAFEWLGLTVDAPVLMIILFFYLFVIVKRGKGMRAESFLKRVSESSEGFYGKFVSLFHSKRTITVAIAGLLALHLLVEIGHFIIPYTTGLLYPWYFRQLGAGHVPLAAHMVSDFASASGITAQIGVMLIYISNLFAVLMLFFGPAYLWTRFYMKKKTEMPNIVGLFFGCITVFLLKPVFRMSSVDSETLIGADITTQVIPGTENIWLVLLAAVLVAGIFHVLARKNLFRSLKLVFAVVLIYLGLYLYYFFTDVAGYYVQSIGLLAKAGQYFIAMHLLIFFTITIVFYIGGYLMFIYEAHIKHNI